MNIADWQTFQRHRQDRVEIGKILLAMLVFASMGAITWAIRGTSGWSGIHGTIVPGMTWGVLWWFICWRRGIDARGVSLRLGLGIAIGGDVTKTEQLASSVPRSTAAQTNVLPRFMIPSMIR